MNYVNGWPCCYYLYFAWPLTKHISDKAYLRMFKYLRRRSIWLIKQFNTTPWESFPIRIIATDCVLILEILKKKKNKKFCPCVKERRRQPAARCWENWVKMTTCVSLCERKTSATGYALIIDNLNKMGNSCWCERKASVTVCALIIDNLNKMEKILHWLERKTSVTGYAFIIDKLNKMDTILQ